MPETISEDVPLLSRLRRRRCRSLSKAENIVTEEEKIRRSQPDKPFHRPRDSLFSWNSGFHNFDGVVNWAFLLLSIGGLRLGLENLNKYGILVDPTKWIFYLLGCTKTGSNVFPTLFMLMFANIPILSALILELLISKCFISKIVCRTFHYINLGIILILPVYVIRSKYEYIGPGMEGAFLVMTVFYIILFMKLYSYMSTMEWVRQDFDRKKSRKILKRERSVQICKTGGHSFISLVQYPNNLTLKDIYYFWLAPTLCYELNFPRSSRTRTLFLLRRALEVLIGSHLMLALIQQWIIPSVVNSLLPFSNMNFSHAAERLLKLSIPNHLIWLTMFYLVFHSFLNTMGEILRFADRGFYLDWWNAPNIVEFWKHWNLPVHKWCIRHLYKPLIKDVGLTQFQARFVVFFLSAVLHEYMVSVPLRMFKAYAFCAMIMQVPLAYLSTYLEKKCGPRFGNLLVWLSLILGQPLVVMMYYHDFVVLHYGTELLQTFGKLN